MRDFPSYGIVMMWGQLKSMNILVPRDRVRESLLRVSPQFVNHRRASAASRRVYSVPSSNFYGISMVCIAYSDGYTVG